MDRRIFSTAGLSASARRRLRGAFAGLLTFLLLAPLLALAKVPALASLEVFPASAHLTTQRDRQSLIVQAQYEDGVTRDVTGEAQYTFGGKTGLARLEKATLYPVEDGETELTVEFDGRKIVVPVKVANAKIDQPISFKLDVMPVFMKAGCNSGSCHGSSRGKDGFRLSLFGYDPDGDYFRLTQESLGRRINLALLQDSLIIEKGAGKVPHTGGQLFTPESELQKTLTRWLEAGAPRDPPEVANLERVELMPRRAVLEGEGAFQKFSVRAFYSDGTDRDMTALAAFFSNNETAAKISAEGLVTAGQRGEVFVTARLATFTVGAQVIVIPKGLDYQFPAIADHNYIDTLVHAKLKKLRLLPSGVCDDATFLRRAYLDIVGLLPPPEEARKFVTDTDPEKRKRLIEKLTDRPEFAEMWVMKWAELLQIRSSANPFFSYKNALAYYQWVRDQVQANVPMDQMVKSLLTASGGTFRNPPANYYKIETDTLKMSENVAQVFMGMRLQCSQCHNHPFDRWTMNDYYSFAAFFPQVATKGTEDPRESIIFNRGSGEVSHPVTRQAMKPRFLGGDEPDLKGRDRREALADWLVAPDNPYFARNLANIVWAHFFGKGIVEPVDDVRISNPPSNPELLDALAARLTEYKYDFKRLVRDLCASRTYQLSTHANESNAGDERNFSRSQIRRLRAELLLDCLNQVAGTQEKFNGLPRGARAVQIADGNETSYFLTTFGRSTRESVCACEVKIEPNLSQALHLLNGDTVQEKTQSGGLIAGWLKEKKPAPEIIEELYMRCLSRPPTVKEQEKLAAFFKDDAKPEVVLTDVFWSLLNSKEFLFNH